MDSLTHVIDPDGNVIILLYNSSSPIAEPSGSGAIIWDTDDQQHDAMQSSPELSLTNEESDVGDSDAEEFYAEHTDGEHTLDEAHPAETTMSHENGPNVQALDAEDSHGADTDSEETHSEAYPDDAAMSDDNASKAEAQKCIRIQVSAKHLTFCSPYFQRILTGNWKESISFFREGSVEITATNWDIHAFMIILRAMHGQNYLIPNVLTLEMLAKVTVIANYYDCKEALHHLGDMWVANLQERIPMDVSRDLMLWIWVAWFFQLPIEFLQSTSIAMSKGRDLIDTLGLPIPGEIMGTINKRREEAISNAITRVHEVHDVFLRGTRGCCWTCQAMMYGSISKQMESCKMPLPNDETHFRDSDYDSLVRGMMAFSPPVWCNSCVINATHGRLPCPPHKCFDSSRSIFAGLMPLIDGLMLNEFSELQPDSSGTTQVVGSGNFQRLIEPLLRANA
ncbi:uncharacterized protein N7506_007468 [Penicillium brevicompactum]|uniref:uncharacterized protein n=1 Tax=Penicillium brevicompactum TaxID=5074 RepID=UPI0025405F6C|nr:uncharacterized protein N7506_007468 [Penicillium brevicompactum]KAJ5333685.1 hypothetical protein N7506_007468 [Penicillium brevicompactum]